METLERAVLSESLTHFNLRLAWSNWAHYIPEPFLMNTNISRASFFYNIFNYTLQHGQLQNNKKLVKVPGFPQSQGHNNQKAE